MKKTKDPFVEKWDKTRDKGFTRYFISVGLIFGSLLFGLISIYDYMFTERRYENSTDALIQLLICILVGGGIYALFMWFLKEMMYKKKIKPKK